jgi:MHS family proline/betaine transporter-like MFS transporter
MNSSQVRRMIAAGLIGNVLEWYDFAIYGYFATAIGRHFFPHEDAVAQLLSAFGVFALGGANSQGIRAVRILTTV